MKSPTKYVMGAAMAASFLVAWHLINLPSPTISYDGVHSLWLSKAIRQPIPADPRADFDDLRPLIDFTSDIVLVHNFEKEPTQDYVDPGWQIAGSVIDIAMHSDATYVLYGRKNAHHLGGSWQDSLDETQSFDDYLVIKRSPYESTVVLHGQLPASNPQTLFGLKPKADNSGFEVMLSNAPGDVQIIDVYQF